jgi:hypothetical protein
VVKRPLCLVQYVSAQTRKRNTGVGRTRCRQAINRNTDD